MPPPFKGKISVDVRDSVDLDQAAMAALARE